MTKIYAKVAMNENEFRVLRTGSGPCLVEKNEGGEDSRFFTVALCQTALEAIKKVDRLIEESDARFIEIKKGA